MRVRLQYVREQEWDVRRGEPVDLTKDMYTIHFGDGTRQYVTLYRYATTNDIWVYYDPKYPRRFSTAEIQALRKVKTNKVIDRVLDSPLCKYVGSV